ncbi:MAG: molybdopterin molybdotransferase MoeA [Pseudomonadota bacterium]
MSGLISVSDALKIIEAHRPETGLETIALEHAQGRRLATPIISKRTHPPAAMSAMDGYAVKLNDVRTQNVRLRVIGEAPAGSPFQGALQSGQAVRVFTGSVVPDGADHIVIQENAQRDGNELLSEQAYDKALHIRAAGLDFSEGDELISSDTVITAPHLSVIAASNHAEVSVHRKLRVGVLSNGDELKPPGSDLRPGEIVNSNPFTLSALIKSWGADPIDLGVAGDRVEDIISVLDQAEDIDVFVPVGGASVGDHDHMQTAFATRGFEPVFSKIAVRPGKPTWFSQSDQSVVLGLPGNPASALVCAHLFLSPLLGAPWRGRLTHGTLAHSISANGPREHFMRAQASLTRDGGVSITPHTNQDSSLLRPFLACNALLRRAPNTEALKAGSVAEVVLIGQLQT